MSFQPTNSVKELKGKCIQLENIQTNSLSLSILMTIFFPGEAGLAGFIRAKDDGSGGDNRSYKTCKAPVKLSPLTNQHPAFYRPDALPVTQSTVSKHWNENYSNKLHVRNVVRKNEVMLYLPASASSPTSPTSSTTSTTTSSSSSKTTEQQDKMYRQTDRQTDRHTSPSVDNPYQARHQSESLTSSRDVALTSSQRP